MKINEITESKQKLDEAWFLPALAIAGAGMTAYDIYDAFQDYNPKEGEDRWTGPAAKELGKRIGTDIAIGLIGGGIGGALKVLKNATKLATSKTWGMAKKAFGKGDEGAEVADAARDVNKAQSNLKLATDLNKNTPRGGGFNPSPDKLAARELKKHAYVDLNKKLDTLNAAGGATIGRHIRRNALTGAGLAGAGLHAYDYATDSGIYKDSPTSTGTKPQSSTTNDTTSTTTTTPKKQEHKPSWFQQDMAKQFPSSED